MQVKIIQMTTFKNIYNYNKSNFFTLTIFYFYYFPKNLCYSNYLVRSLLENPGPENSFNSVNLIINMDFLIFSFFFPSVFSSYSVICVPPSFS